MQYDGSGNTVTGTLFVANTYGRPGGNGVAAGSCRDRHGDADAIAVVPKAGASSNDPAGWRADIAGRGQFRGKSRNRNARRGHARRAGR